MILLALSLSLQPAADKPATVPIIIEPEPVAEVVVRGRRPEHLLTVVVSGELGLQTYVSSAQPMLTCNGRREVYVAGRLNQCWVRARKGGAVTLAATGRGSHLQDWTVAWDGCQPLSDSRFCRLTLSRDSQVTATFSRPAR